MDERPGREGTVRAGFRRCRKYMRDVSTIPLVTCIMPTCDRRRFVPHAVDCFLRQDYPNVELLIVDDGRDAVEDLVPARAGIRYMRMDRTLRIGAKRNEACA